MIFFDWEAREVKEYSYRCEARSIDAFIAQVCRYVGSGHYFYLQGAVPERKDPVQVDRKLIELYGIDIPRWKRARRHLGGRSGLHYLRYRRGFVLMATHGQHQFFLDHENTFRDVRRNALKFHGYSIRYTASKAEGREKVFVRLTRERYLDVRGHLLECAVRPSFRERERFEALVASLGLAWYRPVREQVYRVVQEANKRRRHRGFEKVRVGCIPKRRRLTEVFIESKAA